MYEIIHYNYTYLFKSLESSSMTLSLHPVVGGKFSVFSSFFLLFAVFQNFLGVSPREATVNFLPFSRCHFLAGHLMRFLLGLFL